MLLSLLAAAAWGGADFAGGVASRVVRPIVAVAWVNAIGLAGVGIAALLAGAQLSSGGLAWASAAGAVGILGFIAFYAAMSAGPMSIVAPITASGAAVPALVAVARGDALSPLLAGGLACALAGAVLASRSGGEAPEPGGARVTLSARALTLTLLATAGIGGYLTLVQRATGAAGSDPLAIIAVTRAVELVLCAAALVALRAPAGVPRPARRAVIFAGVADTTANALFATATATGDHAVAAVLSSLYPIGTVLLAGLVLGERLVRAQATGVGLAMLGVVLVSAAA